MNESGSVFLLTAHSMVMVVILGATEDHIATFAGQILRYAQGDIRPVNGNLLALGAWSAGLRGRAFGDHALADSRSRDLDAAKLRPGKPRMRDVGGESPGVAPTLQPSAPLDKRPEPAVKARCLPINVHADRIMRAEFP